MPNPIRPVWVLSSQKPIIRLLARHQYQRLRDTRSSRAATAAITSSHPRNAQSSLPNSSQRPLSLLPLGLLIRSYLFATFSSSQFFLGPSIRVLSVLAHSKSLLLNPARNPLLHYVLKKTFYSHFCAGETPEEVQKTIEGLKRIGYHGVVLTYGKETVVAKGYEASLERTTEDLDAKAEVESWKDGTLETIRLAEKEDMVALRYSGHRTLGRPKC